MNESITTCFINGWKKVFVYKGRATRKAFWLFILANLFLVLFIAGLSFFCLVFLIADNTSRGGMMLIWGFFVYLPLRSIAPVILLVPIISLGIRRMHDTGRSGWWFGGALLINLVVLPLILTGMQHVAVTFIDSTSGRLAVDVISIILSAAATIFILWLCCLPTKPEM